MYTGRAHKLNTDAQSGDQTQDLFAATMPITKPQCHPLNNPQYKNSHEQNCVMQEHRSEREWEVGTKALSHGTCQPYLVSVCYYLRCSNFNLKFYSFYK